MEETSYYRGDYIYANQKPCGNNRERATLFYNKEIRGQGEYTTTRARRRDGVWPRATLSVRLTVGTGEGGRDRVAMRSGQVAKSYWAEVT